MVASDARSARVEELQFTLGEGPCLDALASGWPVLSADLDQVMTRWPIYAPAAYEYGVRAVFAFPLQIGALRVGGLDVYRDRPGSLTLSALDMALAFAEVALLSVLDGQSQASPGEPAAMIEDGLSARSELYQAQGMLTWKLGIDLGEAMIRLRAHAFAINRPLMELARDIVEGKLDLNTAAPGSPP
jgi:hypothetical protein